MLRIERIFEAAGIEEELAVYRPMIPDGHNWKATYMVEYVVEEERKAALARMVGVEDKVWMQVQGFDRIYAIADEDLERSSQEKTSSVHFMRFELTPEMMQAAKSGAALSAGIDHPACALNCALPKNVRISLIDDLV
jgi:hypothetical protein